MDIKAIILGLSFALIWSSAFTSARIIVTQAPPLTISALRFFIAGCIAVAIARMMGQGFRLTPGQWRAVIMFGICQNAIYLGLNFVAMQTVQASLAAIIASSMPLLVALIGWLVLKERVPAIGIIGLILGLAGVGLIMGARIAGDVDPTGIAMCVIAALALAVATLTVKGASSGGNLMTVVGLQMWVGGAVLLVAALIFEEMVINWTLEIGLAFAYTTLVPGVIATFIWFVLVARIGAVKAATFHFLNPFFGVVIAYVLLGEDLSMTDAVGVVVITIGILAVQLSKQKT
ncbi:threonine/homoserine efflux transporter RhtA [Litoreibacter ponti]|uniref:Threonine/homoserine efflux transporter RhtA n=1 Tax=Litoreibacter ponti TaxID=1510457 RepID=A0A2T6BP57_9RHOB|nr:DMT family transporter [Litoreibacter ponti]PTX57851.1 threonine/homoserine efflux transporter RhtA [Litoreibacter ponti]